MKRQYKTDLSAYGIAHAEVAEKIMREFKMHVEREDAVVYHQRKMTKAEAQYVRGVLRGLLIADYDVQ